MGDEVEESQAMLEPDARSTALNKAPLIEAALVFGAFWIGVYFPFSGSVVLDDPLYHLSMAAQLAPKALLLLYLMAKTDGLGAFSGVDRPRLGDVRGAVMVGLGTCLVAVSFSAALSAGFRALGWNLPANPLLVSLGSPASSALILIPAILINCLLIGYTEELYFRVYLPKRLDQAGLRGLGAAAISVLLFASAHGAQGNLGPVVATLIGAWFLWRRQAGANLHELAWGHGLYDFTVFMLALYVRA